MRLEDGAPTSVKDAVDSFKSISKVLNHLTIAFLASRRNDFLYSF
jgi:hypothetical protein